MSEISRMLDIKRTSVYNICHAFDLEGRRHALPRGGTKNRKLTEPMNDFLLAAVEDNPFLTLQQLRTALLAEFHGTLESVDLSTISRSLDGHLFTMKCPSREGDVPEARNTEENKAKRQDFAQWLVNLPPFVELVHLDESGYGVWTRRGFGRSVRGTRVRRNVHTQKSPSVNLILATSPSTGLVDYSLEIGNVNRERVQMFVQRICPRIVAQLQDGHSSVILLDGARFHQGLQIPQEYEDRISIRVFPPYSPFLNPVELAHSTFKAAVKRQLSQPDVQQEFAMVPADFTAKDWRLMVLQRCGVEAIDSITQQKCVRWYQHTLRYIPQCLANVNISG